MQFKLALIQQQIEPDFAKNQQNLIDNIKLASLNHADVVLLSELHSYPYLCQTKDKKKLNLAETIPGLITHKFSELAKILEIIIVASVYEKSANNKFYNTVIVIEKDGTIVGKYRKIHIPNCPEYNESFYFDSGDLGFQTIKTSIGNLGILICYDQWFPEGARKLALNGADIILIPTAIGYTPTDTDLEKSRQLDAWKTIQRSHAIANGIPLASCNRVGFECNPDHVDLGIDFWGNSFICGPFGEMLASSLQEEDIIYSKIDLDENSKVSEVWPFLKERKTNYSL